MEISKYNMLVSLLKNSFIGIKSSTIYKYQSQIKKGIYKLNEDDELLVQVQIPNSFNNSF